MSAPPKYQLLLAQLRERIDGLEIGAPVPSERALAEESGVSRMTARRALAELEREGRLRREVGRGSFVCRPAVTLPLQLTSFSEDMRARGLEPSSRVLSISTEAAGELAPLFAVDASTPITRICRVRLANGRPMAIERTSLLSAAAPSIAAADLENASLYETLESEHDVVFDAGEQHIRAGLISPADADELDTTAGAAALELVRTSSRSGTVIEHTVSIYPGDRFELSAQIAPFRAPGSAPRSALRERG